MDSIYNIYYIEVNTICIIILLMMFFAVRGIKENVRMNVFRGMVVFDIIFCVTDVAAALLNGKFFVGARGILWTVNILYFVSAFIVALLWLTLSMYILEEKIQDSYYICTMVFGVLVVLFFASAVFNGLCFTINEQNVYLRGPLLWIQWIIIIPCILFPALVAPFSKADKREKYVVMAFAVLPIFSVVLQIFVFGITVTQVGSTLSLVMLYIFMQSRSVDEATTRAKLLDEISNTDALTRLKNRRAYENRINEIKALDWVGVVFSDINGLKRTNDSMGHVEGDKMITDYANVLRDYFSDNEIFRISGDEFVVLSVDKQHFENSAKLLALCVGDDASIGMSEGQGCYVLDVVLLAEKSMYHEKGKYYKRSGVERRTV